MVVTNRIHAVAFEVSLVQQQGDVYPFHRPKTITGWRGHFVHTRRMTPGWFDAAVVNCIT